MCEHVHAVDVLGVTAGGLLGIVLTVLIVKAVARYSADDNGGSE